MRTNLPSQLKWLHEGQANIPTPIAWIAAKPEDAPPAGGKPSERPRAFASILLDSDSDSDSDTQITHQAKSENKKTPPAPTLAPSPVLENPVEAVKSSGDSATTAASGNGSSRSAENGSVHSSLHVPGPLRLPETRSFTEFGFSDDDDDDFVDLTLQSRRTKTETSSLDKPKRPTPGEVVSIHSSDDPMELDPISPVAVSRSLSRGADSTFSTASGTARGASKPVIFDDDDFEFEDIDKLPIRPRPKTPENAEAPSDWSDDDGAQVAGTPMAASSPGMRRPEHGPTYGFDTGTELSKLQSEKIGLLERKIQKLMDALSLTGSKVDTKDLDSKIKRIEVQLTTLAEKSIETDSSRENSPLRARIDTFHVEGSPQASRFFPPAPIQQQQQQQQQQQPSAIDSDIDILGMSTTRNNALPSSPLQPSFVAPASLITGVAPAAATNKGHFEIVDATPSQPTKKLPFTNELRNMLFAKFGMHKFRFHQLEAMSATLRGRDVVVLMPTGGGKSLCYQLPALLDVGKTKGLTVVISPLISLMQDQVDHLNNHNISAQMLSSRQSMHDRDQIYALIALNKLSLLYISPEMLNNNTMLNNCLEDLRREGRFARIVIDEAHCVSAWGHDFRTDYKELMQIKNKFTDVPIMALTATANQAVLGDISQCVRSNHLLLTQSFNRTNLYYEVRPKSKNFRAEISALCTRDYRGQCGIIYCRSRDECESLSSYLSQCGLSCGFYHAGMSPEDRTMVQESWQDNRLTVICATIAFGMGIDKPNVRYVIHTTLPRSMEGYYQETGRAGRDGEPSVCILFYAFQDASTLLRLIDQDRNVGHSQKEHQKELLRKTMQYCGNRADCRRKQVLQYFDEDFDPRFCQKQCDNCRQPGQRHVEDVTGPAQLVVRLMQQLDRQRERITLLYLGALLHGKVDKRGRDHGFDSFEQVGVLKSWDRTQLERLLNHLCSIAVLDQYAHAAGGFSHTYVKCGSKAGTLLAKKIKVELEFKTDEPSQASRGSSADSGSRTSSASKEEWMSAHERKRRPGGNSNWRKKRRTR